MESVHELSCSIIPAMISTSSISNWIDEDLIPEILKRLPVKSLVRFRSVCKYWKSLISSYSFIKLHYSFTCSSTPAYLKPYLRRRRANFDDPYGDYSLCRPQEEYIRHHVRFPFRFQYAGSVNKFDFVGLIKGLVCLSYSLDRYNHHLILWNPAIHKYLPLPHQTFNAQGILDSDPECTAAHSYQHALGFGYDTSKDDVKVVRIWIPNYPCDCECKLLPKLDVYSAREGVWRVSIVESIKICQICTETGCFVNGTVHWIVEDYGSGKPFVLMFDCEREEFTTMELPQEFQTDGYVTMELDPLEYGGMLSLLVKYGGILSLLPHWDGQVEMWVMEENATSWKKLYEILGHSELNWNTDISQSSYEKLAPYGPDECIKFRLNAELSDDILCTNVYEESMFLMNDTDSLSYTKAEIVQIDNSKEL